ncbi:hypothetical protein OS493_021147 [Desmophyllum pertusum]|uniref:Uncharacterized protein n=1 Tax=Desmophyllum pertusum TaxID=174260 RepID=A0A9W9ZPG2_9CNID|nr:hypothetical protein OS493_021147 [Desmophyllum pertusum]
MPSRNSKFALEKAKSRSMNPVLVAVLPLAGKFRLRLQANHPQTPPQKNPSQTQMKYFETLCGGGHVSVYDSGDPRGDPRGDPAPVEVYDEKNNTWSVVEQKHIPSNNLGAMEIEGRVYFIINKFPIDSGIRIPPEEQYHVSLNEWKNLAEVSAEAVLCYLPVKRENLKTENGESQTD